ncbi:primosomal protein N' [Candidatus Peregrinibacteria bacterium]|nr:primosomal protein N' [Candidatus Peregrinibacteria bacterium]
MKFAEIVFQKKTVLTYSIPGKMELLTGQLVKVPLRKKIENGLVWKIHDSKPEFKTLAIQEIIDAKPHLSATQIRLIEWMEKYYFCQLYKILKLFIPKRIFEQKFFRKKSAAEKLQAQSTIQKNPQKKLTDEQNQALKKILTEKSNKSLLHGITGSGKTEIYARLAEHFIAKNKQVLILVPEISLTPQTIGYFENALGSKATVIHSKISEGERFQAWTEIWQGKAKFVIGSRSAIFCPFQNLGAIIIDEEHEHSYKQEQSPRYTVHKIAEKILEFQPEIKIILGSATPNIETLEEFKDSTIFLTKRIGDLQLPDVEIIDLREEFKKKNKSIFSEKLQTEIQKTLDAKEQIILFINRRGAASSVVCRDCGYTEKCPNCELPLTYHASTLSTPGLICHHCGKIAQAPSTCKTCQGGNIRFLGIGTQKIESELLKEFPGIKVLRADKDTTSRKNSFEKIYRDFKNGQADVLIGTQMIAKGLHMPKVRLVGVILADIGLNIPDFRAAERNFQLMTQVAGRAGRSNRQGKVIIQTYNPGHVSLLCTKNHDYTGFMNYERTQRQILKNPPFSRLAKITVENKILKNCREESEKIDNLLWKLARENNLTDNLEINNYPAYIMRLHGKYRHILLIKSPAPHTLLEKLPEEYIMAANIKIDVDPIQVT